MLTLNLEAQLSGHAFSYLLIFTRLGGALMLFPGIGEAFVPPRVRMMLALFLSLLLFPVLAEQLPSMPNTIPDLVRLVVFEALIGIFFGFLLRLLVGAIETAGSVIAVQIGLSNAMVLNPTLGAQNALPSSFLGIAGVTLLFLTGLDHMLLRGLIGTYDLLPVGKPLMTGDMSEAYVRLFSKSFLTGVEIAAPFLIVGLMLYTALGFMQRMVAQVQLFLVALPFQIMAGLFLLATAVGVMLLAWLKFFDESLAGILR